MAKIIQIKLTRYKEIKTIIVFVRNINFDILQIQINDIIILFVKLG